MERNVTGRNVELEVNGSDVSQKSKASNHVRNVELEFNGADVSQKLQPLFSDVFVFVDGYERIREAC